MIDCSKCPDKGCCCGIFQMDKKLVEKHKDKFQVETEKIVEDKNWIALLTKDLGCIFLNRKTKNCMIYEDRPEVCRLYGISKDPRLQCPYFKRSGARRSPGSQKKVEKKIDSMTKQIMAEGERKGITPIPN